MSRRVEGIDAVVSHKCSYIYQNYYHIKLFCFMFYRCFYSLQMNQEVKLTTTENSNEDQSRWILKHYWRTE